MCPSLVEIRSVTSKIRRRKKKEKEKATAVKYESFGIAKEREESKRTKE